MAWMFLILYFFLLKKLTCAQNFVISIFNIDLNGHHDVPFLKKHFFSVFMSKLNNSNNLDIKSDS